MNITEETSWFSGHPNNSSSLESEGRQALFGSCVKKDSYGNCCPPVVNALAWLALLAGIALATFFLRKGFKSNFSVLNICLLRNAIIANIVGRSFGRAFSTRDGTLPVVARWAQNQQGSEITHRSGGLRRPLEVSMIWS